MRSKNTDDEVIAAVAASTSVRGALVVLGRNPTGEGHRSLKRRIAKLGLATSHFKRPYNSPTRPSRSLEQWLQKGTVISSHKLKMKLLRATLLKAECVECEMPPSWRGKPLSLHLDHIDGDHTNNELINLRLLCPNCHSQTRTYAGRNISDRDLGRRFSRCSCGRRMQKESQKCKFCSAERLQPFNTPKIDWPPKEILGEMIWDRPVVRVARELGVSDNAVRKHCKKNEIPLPPRGHWGK